MKITYKKILAMLLAATVTASAGSFAFAEDDGLNPDVYASRMERRAAAEAENDYFPEEEDDFISDEDLLLQYGDDESWEDSVTGEEPVGPVIIDVEILSGDEITHSSVLCFTSRITEELDWETVTYQWQTSTDGEEWFDVEGATERDYNFQLDETNGRYYWRLVVSYT